MLPSQLHPSTLFARRRLRRPSFIQNSKLVFFFEERSHLRRRGKQELDHHFRSKTHQKKTKHHQSNPSVNKKKRDRQRERQRDSERGKERQRERDRQRERATDRERKEKNGCSNARALWFFSYLFYKRRNLLPSFFLLDPSLSRARKNNVQSNPE